MPNITTEDIVEAGDQLKELNDTHPIEEVDSDPIRRKKRKVKRKKPNEDTE